MMGIHTAVVVVVLWVTGLDRCAHAFPDGFFDEAIITRGQHRSILPMSMSWLPDSSGRYLVADKHGKIWIGADPTVSSGTLEVYMHMPYHTLAMEVGQTDCPSASDPALHSINSFRLCVACLNLPNVQPSPLSFASLLCTCLKEMKLP